MSRVKVAEGMLQHAMLQERLLLDGIARGC
jgi:hypothetical protein